MTDTPVDYDFEDYNATFVFQPSEKDKVTANFYYGSDYLDIETGIYQTEGRIKWSNIAASILWNRPLGRIGEMTHTFYITRYKNRLSISQNQFTAWLPSEITDYGYKNIFSFREEKFLGTYRGWNMYIIHVSSNCGNTRRLYHTHRPGESDYIAYTKAALFINGKYFFSPRLSAEAGLRYSGTAQFGKFNYHTSRQGEIIDTQTYGKGELIKFYGGFEPRIALYFLPGSNQRISLSYNLTRQYIGQVSSSSIGFLPISGCRHPATFRPNERILSLPGTA